MDQTTDWAAQSDRTFNFGYPLSVKLIPEKSHGNDLLHSGPFSPIYQANI